MLSRISSSALSGLLKGTHDLLLGARSEPGLAQRLERDINVRLEQFSKVPLQANLVEGGVALRLVERDHEIDVGFVRVFAACHRADHADPEDTQVLQFALVRPQRRG